MTYQDAVFDRILELEDSLRKSERKYAQRYAETGSRAALSKYTSKYETYLLNIAIHESMSGQSYEPQVKAME